MNFPDNFNPALHQAFADLMGRLHEQLGGKTDDRPQVQNAALALMQAQDQGHACLPLSEVLALNPQALHASPVFNTPGAPLVLTAEGHLYLRRYFHAEQQLAQQLRAFDSAAPLTDDATLQAALNEVFAPASSLEELSTHKLSLDNAADTLPRQAVFTALTRRLCVLCGGPGTGKTYTLARLVQALRLVQPQLRIALAAPTGKAATRLQSALNELPQTPGLTVSTLHRLLGLKMDNSRGNSSSRTQSYDSANHALPADVVIVDEASMLGLSLAEKLFAALLPSARVILVGDPNQLAAVETGSVLTPLANSTSPAVVRLQHAWRFAPDSNVPLLAQAVLQGDAATLLEHTQPALPNAAQLFAGYENWWQAVQQNAAPEELLKRFDDYRVLAAVREGPRGVHGLNAALTKHCRTHLSNLLSGHLLASASNVWFAGRPVIITRNDSATQLVNGDIGLAWPDDASGWRVYFKDAANGIRSVAYTDLPPHETAFALTVHKAQGSEYREVALVLPEPPSRVLTRELLYTGITRAKSQVHLFASAAALQTAVTTPSLRWSGLKIQTAELLSP